MRDLTKKEYDLAVHACAVRHEDLLTEREGYPCPACRADIVRLVDGPVSVPPEAAREGAVAEGTLSVNADAIEVRKRFDVLMERMDEFYPEQGMWDAQVVACYLVQEARFHVDVLRALCGEAAQCTADVDDDAARELTVRLNQAWCGEDPVGAASQGEAEREVGVVVCGSVADGTIYREYGCGRSITMDTGVRCLDCGIRLCDECAKKHFTETINGSLNNVPTSCEGGRNDTRLDAV